MHELSIALSLLDVAAEEAQRRGAAQVLAIHMRLGPLAGVVKESLLSAYELASETSELKGCRLLIEEVPVVAYCPSCRSEQMIPSILEMTCPVCGAPTPDVRHGRELEVFAMEICQ